MTAIGEDVRSLVGGVLGDVRAIRHDLHAHPELMYEEVRTSRRVCEVLEEIGIEYRDGLAGGTGVVAHLPSTSGGESCVGLRADMDALPIEEETGVAYESTKTGVMHACGHDGHTAMLLGAAMVLSRLEERPHGVTFVFQPAEEGGAGGRRMCEDGCLDGSLLGGRVERMYGLHGWPLMGLGDVGTRGGPLLAATDDFEVRVRGRQAHAAMPQMGVDPIVAGSAIVSSLQTICSRSVDPLESVVCTVGRFLAGSANNVIPREACLTGTIRTLSEATRTLAEERFRAIVSQVAIAHGCEAHIDWHVGYPVTRNDEDLAAHWEGLAREVVGDGRVVEVPRPFMGGEDFAFYGQHIPSCFFLLGLCPDGEDKPALLHTPGFDFNDDAIETGIEMFVRLALDGGPDASD
ncbi:MAG: M20 metallopeptidase family protein [Planctomycetota bacterium]|jgi:amidohydrolase